jgi:hypothetical protein
MPWAFFAGAAVGVLGGRIGLGGAEFRLPLLIGVFGIAAFAAAIMNKAMSLIVVLSALPAQLVSGPWSQVSPHWPVVVNLLAGSLFGAWLGATWATRMRLVTLYRGAGGAAGADRSRVGVDALRINQRIGVARGWRFPSAFAARPGQRVALVLPGLPAGCLGHWHLHELRHSGASLMLAQGTDLYVVSEVLGHSSVAITKDVYGHLVEGQKRAAAALMSKALLTPDGSHNGSQSAPAPGADAG